MVTVIRTPLGHKLTDAELDATVTSLSGEALFNTLFAHGLVDGDYVYIQSNIESYNGFKYVDQTAYNSFKIRDSANSAAVAYRQDATAVYKISVLSHGWQCVHLPIVYELESTIYPSNTTEEDYAYPARVVVSQSANDGYTQLELNSALPDPQALGWIELVGPGGLAGAYQIVEVLQDWSIVINLAYSSGNSFSGYAVVTYYNNYCINVNVYAGLPAGHRWEDEKTYELAATLQLIPDENNRVIFSISEILRGYIDTRNNLTLDTLPNNLDFMVGFYISYFESYDQSDGEEITTYETVETQDTFEGFAVNAKLPFKSENISHMSDYLNEDTYLAQWLTIQTQPIAIVGRFFDLSFLLRFSGVDVQIIQNGVLLSTITNPGLGVIRVPLDFDTAGEFCIQAITPGISEIPGATSSITLPALNTGANIAGIHTNWTTGSNPTVTISCTGLGCSAQSDIWAAAYAFITGYSYTITPSASFNNGDGEFVQVYFVILDASDNIIYSDNDGISALDLSGTFNTAFTFTAPVGAVKFGFYCVFVSGQLGSKSFQIDIDSYAGTVTTPSTPGVDAQDLTEEICITVLEECDDTLIPDDDNIRLLEDGDFRILE